MRRSCAEATRLPTHSHWQRNGPPPQTCHRCAQRDKNYTGSQVQREDSTLAHTWRNPTPTPQRRRGSRQEPLPLVSSILPHNTQHGRPLLYRSLQARVAPRARLGQIARRVGHERRIVAVGPVLRPLRQALWVAERVRAVVLSKIVDKLWEGGEVVGGCERFRDQHAQQGTRATRLTGCVAGSASHWYVASPSRLRMGTTT